MDELEVDRVVRSLEHNFSKCSVNNKVFSHLYELCIWWCFVEKLCC